MAYTEFLFDPETVKNAVEEMTANLQASKDTSDFKGHALNVIKRRLAKEPARYRDYGPYWWEIKRLLGEDEYYLGSDDDVGVRETYSGETPEESIVKADMFRDLYLSTFFVGSNQFDLDGSGDVWTLWDDNMETAIAQSELM